MTLIKMRRGTEAEWLETNPVLAPGEFGYSIDFKKIKIGDGSTIWQFLPFQANSEDVFLATSPEYSQDAVAAMLAAGTHSGIQFVYDDVNQRMNAVVTVGAGANFTIEDAQDAIGALIANGTHSGITFVYDDTNNRLNATVPPIINFSTEDAQDATATLFANGTHSGIQFVYDDANNKLSATVTAAGADTGQIADKVLQLIANGSGFNNSILVNLQDGEDLLGFYVDPQWVRSVALAGTPSETPAYAGNRLGSYNSNSRMYNVNDTTARGVRYSLAEALTGSSLVPFVFMGDSITAGHKATPGVSDPVTMLRNLLISEGYPVTGGWVYPANGTTRDVRWNITGTWADAASTVTNFLDTVQNGATATFVGDFPGTIVEFTVFSTSNTTITYQIDGAAPVVYNVTAGALRKVQITGLIDTTHTVIVTNTGSSQRLWLGPARIRQATGLSITNAGIFGSRASDWLPTALSNAYFNPYNLLGSLELPKLAFISLGANEIISDSASNETSIANTMGTLCNALSSANVPVILRSYPPSIADSITAASHSNMPLNTFSGWQKTWFQVSDNVQVPLIDHFGGLGTQVQYKAAGLSWTDNIHPLDRGYASVARRDLAALKGLI